MGVEFTATVTLSNPDGDRLEVEALVDTGASDSMFPASMLEALRLRPKERVRYALANGSEETYGRGSALVSIADREGHCPVVFGPHRGHHSPDIDAGGGPDERDAGAGKAGAPGLGRSAVE